MSKFLAEHQDGGIEWLYDLMWKRFYDLNEAMEAWDKAGRPGPKHNTTKAVRDARAMSGALIAWDPGLGKTRLSLSVLWAYQGWLKSIFRGTPWEADFLGKPNIVLVPAQAMLSWEDEHFKWSEDDSLPDAPYTILAETSKIKFQKALETAITIRGTVIMSYDALRARLKDTPQLQTTRWGLLIADEVHYLQNPKALRTQAAWLLTADFRIGLSGTPYTNRIPQLYHVATFLQGYTSGEVQNKWLPQWYGKLFELGARRYYRQSPEWGSYSRFLDDYATTQTFTVTREIKTKGGYPVRKEVEIRQFVGSRNLTHDRSIFYACKRDPPEKHKCMALNDRLNRELMHRIRKEDVLDMPPLLPVVVSTPLTATQKKLYNQVADGIIRTTEMEEERGITIMVSSILAKLTYAFEVATDPRQLVESAIRGKLMIPEFEDALPEYKPSSSSKLKALVELMQEIPPDDKVLVFTEFAITANLLAEEPLLEEYAPVLIVGGQPLSKTREAVDKLNNDPNTRMLIATSAGFEGLNLQRASNVVLYGKVSWSPAKVLQAIDRAHRWGQDKPVTVFHMVAPGTVEEWLYRQLTEKQEDFDLSMDGKEVDTEVFSSVKPMSAKDLKAILRGGI